MPRLTEIQLHACTCGAAHAMLKSCEVSARDNLGCLAFGLLALLAFGGCRLSSRFSSRLRSRLSSRLCFLGWRSGRHILITAVPSSTLPSSSCARTRLLGRRCRRSSSRALAPGWWGLAGSSRTIL
eukprot:66075-Prymnesium_polylepis.1